ncbi:hydroxyacid dehydrogenase [bacterium]|nr:hydroxyacid dehydrogenase [bacterium]|tara:strand:+ start:7376 stop:8374 length:999 start_codon:yes stop_codon:yes gene_type:complete
MNISFFSFEGWEEAHLKKNFSSHELKFVKSPLTLKNAKDAKDAEVISVFVDSKMDKAMLDKLPNLKFVTTRSTGFDHIDLKECKKRGITASYVPGYGDNTVAEFTFGLILNLSRKIYWGIDRLKETSRFEFMGLRGIDLKGKTIGVVGTGRIGKEVVRIARGFDMNIIAFDVVKDAAYAKKMGYKYVSLEALLKKSDFVTLHCPLNKHTNHLINKKNIKLMKPTAYLINAARGGLVETEALVEALKKKKIAGAGLDVLEEEVALKEKHYKPAKGEDAETMLQDHILIHMDNVLITPHDAFNSVEAHERILDITIGNIKGFIKGKPENVVPEE